MSSPANAALTEVGGVPDHSSSNEKINLKTKEAVVVEPVGAGKRSSRRDGAISLPSSFDEGLRYAQLARTQESGTDTSSNEGAGSISDSASADEDAAERLVAQRALRRAGWASVFFLITTDILGPYNAPFAIASVGYGTGITLYIVFGALAFYTGIILSVLYCRLDSPRFPIKTYGDITHRLLGPWAAAICTCLQTLQLIIIVGVICLANGQGLSQVINGSNKTLCFSVSILVWALFGMFVGQIRSLKNYGWLAYASVFLNLIVIFTSMGFVSHSPPSFDNAASNGFPDATPDMPVHRKARTDYPLSTQINGVLQLIYAYGGSMIFPEMMVEMRRPMDFWKGMACAQLLISSVYLLYGVFVYSFQGQFTLPLAYQGVSVIAWQDVGNVLSLITGIIAAGLYANIGIKVSYRTVVEGWFHGPPLMSRTGRIIWTGMVFGYWSLAFVLGSAIPQVGSISSLVSAIAILQFTYTFPPILLFQYLRKSEGIAVTQDGFAGFGWERWLRARPLLYHSFKWLNFVFFMAGLAFAGLGVWASSETIKVIFANGASTSFGCTPPV